MERDASGWDERRWGPPPPEPDPGRAERPALLTVAAVVTVGTELLGVTVYSRSGWVVGAVSVGLVGLCAWGLLDGRGWARWAVIAGSLLQLLAVGVAVHTGLVGWGAFVPSTLRLELVVRAVASLFVLYALGSPAVGRFMMARRLERMG